MVIGLLTEKCVSGFLAWFGEKRRVRVLTHRATLLNSRQECLFINVTNLSKTRDIEVTHVYLELPGGMRHVLQQSRQLPKRLSADESWETFLDVDQVLADLGEQVFTMARVRLSAGKIVKSLKNESVPSAGIVPGGPIS